MTQREERVRFCDQCNAVIGWFADYCEECGGKLGAENRGARLAMPAPPTAPSVEKDLFKAHMRLIHRFKEQGMRLGRSIDRLEKAVRDVEHRRPDTNSRRALLGLSERVIELEQEWEDLQRAYNAQSETIEEQFLERIEDLEADIELLPDHQHAIDQEIAGLLAALEDLEKRLRETGRHLDLAVARHRSRVLGLSTGPGGTLALGILAFSLAAAGAAYGVFVAGLPSRPLAISLIPAWLGLCALFLNARAKSL